MVLKNKVSDSAYLVNISRTKSVNISKDIFSHFWIPINQQEEAIKLWDAYSESVYPYDNIELGIRTQYFLNFLNKQIKRNKDFVFINIGAGFTSYQYLVKKSVTTIEVDYRDIINAKKRRAKKLYKSEVLPKRETHYISCNLSNKRSRVKAFKKIKRIVNKRKTLVICEGLFYYLKKETVETLLHNLSILQSENDLLGFDYWMPTLKNSPFYRSMINFYMERMGVSESQISLFNLSDIQSLDRYKLIEDTNVFEQESRLTNSSILRENEKVCLEENYARYKLKKPIDNEIYR